MRYTDLKIVLGVLFATSIIVANITAAKIAYFGGVSVPAGFVGIGVAFLCTDLMGELYGKEYAKSVVNATVGGLILAWGLIYVSILMPAAPYYEAHDAFVTTLSGSSTIITAGIITTLVSQNIDVVIFHKLRQVSNRKWLRNLGSTGVSQFVDTTMFIAFGFVILPQIFGGSAVAITAAVSMVIGQYVVKLVVAVLDTPFFLLISSFLEDTGGVDVVEVAD